MEARGHEFHANPPEGADGWTAWPPRVLRAQLVFFHASGGQQGIHPEVAEPAADLAIPDYVGLYGEPGFRRAFQCDSIGMRSPPSSAVVPADHTAATARGTGGYAGARGYSGRRPASAYVLSHGGSADIALRTTPV